MEITNCIGKLVGLRGVCDSPHPYYLDTIGISLNKAAKIADSSSITGKQLFNDAIAMAWEVLKGDININGFGVKGVIETYSNKTTTYKEYNNTVTYTKEIQRECELEAICVENIQVKIINNAKITLTIDGIVYYNSTHNNEVVTIPIGKCYDSDILNIVVEIAPVLGDGNDSMEVEEDEEGIGFSYIATRKCSEDILYCKYASWLVMALMYKTGSILLSNILFSDRYNDMIAYGKVEAQQKIAMLDSDNSILPKELSTGNKGLYQKEIIKINEKLAEIAKESKCKCCFVCKESITAKIAIP